MTSLVVIRRLAEAEIAEAIAWYELQVSGLGLQFLDQFEENVKMIAESPLRWPIYIHDIRRYAMSRFPYIIYFQTPLNTVRILSVVHTSKDPDAMRRLFEN